MAIQLYLRTSEVKLVEALNRVRENAVGWQVIHFHLSDLYEQYKSEYQIKIAVNLINDLLKNYEGGIFVMADSSIVVMCYGLEKTVLEKLVFQLRYLYMDDPLAYSESGQENPAFSTMYELKRQWNEFHELASRRLTISMRRAQLSGDMEPEKALEFVKEMPEANGSDFSAARLATVEQDLRRADLQKVLRQQPVCAVMPNMTVRRVFDELYIHIAHLREMLKSDVDFLSNRWLFKYLTGVLDERMIALIRHRPARYLAGPVSINLNVETLLSSHFAEFDAAIPPASRVSIVLEVPVVDVFADMAAFTLARQEVQKLGYRVCLDGLTAASLISINRDNLGVDLVKVQWNADAQSDLTTPQNVQMAQAVKRTGNNRVILCRCDNRSAVEYGQALGISLFQGRYIDSVLNPTAKQQN